MYTEDDMLLPITTLKQLRQIEVISFKHRPMASIDHLSIGVVGNALRGTDAVAVPLASLRFKVLSGTGTIMADSYHQLHDLFVPSLSTYKK